MLKIKNLYVKTQDHLILKKLNLNIETGEIHVIMGPNGCGKSTLSKVIAGHPEYQITKGHILYKKDFEYIDIRSWTPDQRVKEGIFTTFQYPIEVPGVSNLDLLKASFQSVCKHQGAPEMKKADFQKWVEKKMTDMKLPLSLLERSVNEDFSGGEKKRNEIVQMALLSPRLAVLDETDSGLDIDSLAVTAHFLNNLKTKSRSFLFITHYSRLLQYIQPNIVHIMTDGRIQKSGGPNLADELEEKGYSQVAVKP